MIGVNTFQVDPPHGQWIPPGYGVFEAVMEPGREALMIKYGVIVVEPN